MSRATRALARRENTTMRKDGIVWIKGAGDIGSAVGHRLYRAGMGTILAELPVPVISRRRMAFGGALHDGEAVLEGLRGVRCANLGDALNCLKKPDSIPVLAWEDERADVSAQAQVVVDARMRKRSQPPLQMEEAPLVIGIGPGFEAGRQVHLGIESNWGEGLGRVIREGAAMAYTGEPRAVEGYARERYLYAPHAGTFRTEHDITDRVRAGDIAGWVDDTPLRVEISGILRGVVQNGVRVGERAKLVEVDPRGEASYCVGIAERPARIAEGVFAAIGERMPHLAAGCEDISGNTSDETSK